jgi:hypothetical protein
MARRQTMPAFGAAWAPLTDQGRGRSRGRSRFGVGRWLAVGIVAGLSAALLAYVIATDQAPGSGLSIRSWATLGLAAVALGVLVLRHRWGWRELARTLAEYATVATLAGLLVLAAAPPPVDQAPARAGQARREAEPTRPATASAARPGAARTGPRPGPTGRPACRRSSGRWSGPAPGSRAFGVRPTTGRTQPSTRTRTTTTGGPGPLPHPTEQGGSS